MGYKIQQSAEAIAIAVEVPAAQRAAMIEALGECAQGRCECSTPQYEKVESLEIARRADGVDIVLKPKSGMTIETSDLEKCLESTLQKASAGK